MKLAQQNIWSTNSLWMVNHIIIKLNSTIYIVAWKGETDLPALLLSFSFWLKLRLFTAAAKTPNASACFLLEFLLLFCSKYINRSNQIKLGQFF